MSEYKYKIYGINILSSFPIPELIASAEEAPDLKISLGKTPEKLAANSLMGALWQEQGEKLLLDIKEAARFLIIGGDEIIVEPYAENITQEIRNFLLGAVLGAVLAARKMVLLKAGAVWTNHGGASIFIGNCGAGKSVMVASLVRQGFPMMADDKVCLALDASGIVNVLPAVPQIRLLEHAAITMNFPVEKATFVPEFGQFFIPVDSFYTAAAPLKTAYLLAANNKASLDFNVVNQFAEKYELLNRHVYLPGFVSAPQTRMMYFSVLSAAAKQISMTIINRPLAEDTTEEVTARIAEELAK